MKDRFDLENAITHVGTTAQDIRIVADMVYDSDLVFNADRLHTVLHGLAEVLDAKVCNLEDVYAQVFELNQYCTDSDVLERRNAVYNEGFVHD